MSSYLMHRKKREEEERRNPTPAKRQQTAEEVYGMPEGADLTRHLQAAGKLLAPVQSTYSTGTTAKGQGNLSLSAKAAAEALQRIAKPVSGKVNTTGQYQGIYAQKQSSPEAAKQRDHAKRVSQMEEYRNELSARLFAPTASDEKQIMAKGSDAWRREMAAQLDTLDRRIAGMKKQEPGIKKAADARKGSYETEQYKKAVEEAANLRSKADDQKRRLGSMEKLRDEINGRLQYPSKEDIAEMDRVGEDTWRMELQKDLHYLDRAIEKQKSSRQENRNAAYTTLQQAKRAELEDVLGDPQAQAVIAAGKATKEGRYWSDPDYRAAMGHDDSMIEMDDLDYLTDAERNTLLYYAGKGDWETAQQYYDVIRRDLQGRMNRDTTDVMEEFSNKHKVLGAGANILASLSTPFAYAETLRQAGKNLITGEDEPVNTASPMMLGANIANATQEGITRDMGAAGKFLTGTGLSIGQNIARLPMGPTAGLISMGLGAAGQTSMEAAERGASAGQAATLGTLSGMTEILTEKIPLDNIFELARQGAGRGFKNAAKAVLKQMGAEATEETISEYANRLADNIVMADQSEMQQYIQQLTAQGMSRDDAQKAAALEFWVKQPALAGLGGAISGGVMSSGAQAMHAMSRAGRDERSLQNLMDSIQKLQQIAEKNQQQDNFDRRRAELLGEALPRPIPYAPGSPEEAAHQARQTAIDGEPGSGYTEGIRKPDTIEGTGEGNNGREEAYNRRGDHEPIGTFEAILSEFERREFGGNKERHGEALGTFIQRAGEAGREIGNEGNLIYSFRRADSAQATAQALETQRLLNDMGKTTILIDGPLEEYQDGTVLAHNADAMTGPDGAIYIRADTTENPNRVAFHELYHELTQSAPEEAQRYHDAIFDGNIDSDNEKYGLMESITGMGIFGRDYVVSDPKQKVYVYNEIAAQLAGEIEESPERARYRYGDMVKDFGRVEQAWYMLRGSKETGGNGRQETAHTGDDPGRAGAIQEGNERIPGPEGSGDVAEAGSGVLDTADSPQNAGRTAAEADAGGGAGNLHNGAEVGRIPENPQRAPQVSAGDAGSQLTRKGETYLKRAQRRTVDVLAAAMDVPEGRQRDTLLPLVDEITQELQRTGHLSQETADAAFEKIYGAGVNVLDEFYNEHRDLQQELRASRLQLADQDRADIADFEAFQRSNQGRLTIVRQDGIPVDVKYMELASRYPDLFPAEITHPADQLQRIAAVQKSITKTEMSLDQYHGADAERYKKFARYEFDQAIEKLAEEVGYVQRYENDRQSKNQRVEMPDADLDAIRQAYARNAQLQKESQKVMAKHLLTEADSRQVDRLLGGEITPEELPSGANREGILAVYKAKKAQQDNMAIVRQYRGQLKEARQQRALELVENADAWQDKKMGFAYSRETAERNIQDIMGKEDAARINAEYFQPVHQAEAESVRLQNRLRDQIRDLHISQKPQYSIIYKDPATGEPRMTKASESTLVQLLGEKVITPKAVQACGADVNKIQNAVDVFRKTYNTLFKLANDSLIRNGYAPVEYRQDYFPHFQDNKPDSVLAKIAYTLGMKVEDNKLPTDIAGMTHTFKPGKKWVGNFLQRKGQATTYDALAGFDRYLNGAADVIFHTDNIQGLRSLESALRYKYSDEGTQAEIDAIRTRKDIDEFTREAMLEAVYERDRSNLPNLVTWLRNYTDLLAGKKHPSDRSTEHELGRKIYDVSKALEGRVAANMVALNPGSWLTNFIPLTQGASQVKTWSMLKAMKDSLVNEFRDDGFVDASDFLTNRRGVDPLVKGTAEKMSETLSKPMFYIDDFTANTLVRARYSENINNGMEPAAAMQDADAWTAGIMADRSKGATPTLFNKRNPLAKTVTMFQLEVNNQLSYIFKDLPREEKQKGCLAIAAALLKMFVGAYLYNEVYEKLTGRRSALDPIDIIKSAVEDFADDDTRASEAMENLVGNVADQVPFVGGFIGGGRIPISSAIPDVSQLKDLADKEVDKAKKRDILLREIGGKAGAYLALPFGGGQIKKIAEAADIMHKGGSYTMNEQGERQLQFLADQTPQAAVKAATFGKYSLPQGQRYIRDGFNKLSVKQTEVVDEARKRGMDPQAVVDLLGNLKGIKAMKDEDGKTIKGEAAQKREVIAQSDFSAEDKNWLDSQLINDGFFLPKEVEADYSSEAALGISEYGTKVQEKADSAKKAGIDEETFLAAYEAQRGKESDKGKDGQTILRSKDKKRKAAVDEATPDLSRYKRQKLYEILGISKQVW